jgi:hypothetical protein
MDAPEIIHRFVIARLPDSLGARTAVLEALLKVTRTPSRRDQIFALLNLLGRHCALQQEFARSNPDKK